jgi:hypothetical protein
MQVNLYRDVRAAYMKGTPQSETMQKYDIKQYEYVNIINKIVKSFRPDLKEDRIQQARIMERNIFDLIKKKKDVSGLVKQFSSYCA